MMVAGCGIDREAPAIIEEDQCLDPIDGVRYLQEVSQDKTLGAQFIVEQKAVVAVDDALVVTANGRPAAQAELFGRDELGIGVLACSPKIPGESKWQRRV